MTGKAAPGRWYAPATAAHSESVLRGFYDFHQDAGTGPMVNPFPLARGRRGGRARPHHNPAEPYRPERAGLYRPRLAGHAPHHIPEGKFSELFAALGSHRDRALVAFWVSTGARASELLGASCRDADPGQQLITVIRKGTRHLQPSASGHAGDSGRRGSYAFDRVPGAARIRFHGNPLSYLPEVSIVGRDIGARTGP